MWPQIGFWADWTMVRDRQRHIGMPTKHCMQTGPTSQREWFRGAVERSNLFPKLAGRVSTRSSADFLTFRVMDLIPEM